MSDDRQVHAECKTFEVVRYDRSGKWYIEPKNGGKREHVGVKEAAKRALACQVLGGVIHFGEPGGSVFVREVDRLP